ncbi:MAG: hypothetical protein FJZ11_05780 [Candidatus Omnitrophica bacterium]|nr:hypothetical protein [Candidatus Omnitrophota bacterium]
MTRLSNVVGRGGTFAFYGQDSNNAEVEYGRFGFLIGSNTAGAQSGDLVFYTTNAGSTVREAMRIKNGNVGIGTTSPTYILSLEGGAARTFWMERNTVANTQGYGLTIQAGGATSGATDKNSGDLLLACGTATGSGYGSVKLQAVTAGASGTADRTVTTHLEVGNSKFAVFGGTTAVQQSHIVDADGSLADITTKFNTLLASLESYGWLKTS